MKVKERSIVPNSGVRKRTETPKKSRENSIRLGVRGLFSVSWLNF